MLNDAHTGFCSHHTHHPIRPDHIISVLGQSRCNKAIKGNVEKYPVAPQHPFKSCTSGPG